MSTISYERKRVGFVPVFVSILLFAVSASPQDPARLTPEELHRMHQDSKAYIAFLEDPQRDAYQKPHEVMMALGIRQGERIADIGAGSGYFALRFARHVGAEGRVYAVDINPDMIRHLNRRIHESQLQNIVTVLADPDDPLLPSASLDRIFICDTWHHIGNQPAYLGLLKKALRPGGQIVMIDFKKQDSPMGPPLEMRIARPDLVSQMESNGFSLFQEHTFLPYQYFLVFKVR